MLFGFVKVDLFWGGLVEGGDVPGVVLAGVLRDVRETLGFRFSRGLI